MKELNIIKNEKLREIYKRRYLGRRFNYGDIMATDLLLIEMDESALTGESDP